MSPEECWARLAANPEDWDARAKLAQLCEADVAECVRWMVLRRKRPRCPEAGPGAAWFNGEKVSAGLGDPESDLPEALYRLLEGGREIANHRAFPTLRAAEESLHAAWAAARRRGWAPDVP